MTDCEKMREENKAKALKYKKSMFLPECNAETGAFESKQCLPDLGLCWCVDEDGKPRNLQIARPLGAGLDDKSVEAVETWKFEPAQKDGKPVRVAIMVEVTFHLY